MPLSPEKRAVERIWIACAALSGGIAVAAEAAARHLLDDPVARDWVATGARYGLVHGLALIAVTILRLVWHAAARGAPRHWLALGGWCFVAGLIAFSGGLYALAAGAPPAVARVVPLGGTLFIAGWAALLVSALVPGQRRS